MNHFNVERWPNLLPFTHRNICELNIFACYTRRLSKEGQNIRFLGAPRVVHSLNNFLARTGRRLPQLEIILLIKPIF